MRLGSSGRQTQWYEKSSAKNRPVGARVNQKIVSDKEAIPCKYLGTYSRSCDTMVAQLPLSDNPS